MTDICQVEDCDRPVSDAWCCVGCAYKLEKALGDGSWVGEELDIVLARLMRYEEHSERTNGGRVTPLFFNDSASEAGWVLRNTLTTWARLVAEERGHDLPSDTIAAMSGWLLSHVEWIRHHRAGHEAIEEITSATYQAKRVIDRPNNRTTFAIGPCPELGCQGEVRVYIPAREDQPAHMDCGDCGERWASVQFARVGKRIRTTEVQRISPYIDTATAAVALGVTDRRIRQLCVAGMLTNYGTPARILLDLTEVEAHRTRRDGEMLA